jgi:hypothetical protein
MRWVLNAEPDVGATKTFVLQHHPTHLQRRSIVGLSRRF